MMTPLESQKLVFNSVLDCIVAGQERYIELFFYMLDHINYVNDLFSEEEIFLQLCQFSKSKTRIDVFEKFLSKIIDSKNIFKLEENTSGNNILHLLLKNKAETKIIQLFLNYIQDDAYILNYQNKQGDTPLHFAVKYTKDFATVSALLKYKVALNIANKDKNTSLHYSVMLLTHNREFCPEIIEQQTLIFDKLISACNKETLKLKNKHGNTIIHQMIADIDSYRGIINSKDAFTFEELLRSFKTRKTDFKHIIEFFRSLYPNAIQNIATKIKNMGLDLKEKNNLNFSAFQLAFIKKHFSAIKALFSLDVRFSNDELNALSSVITSFVKNANTENLESLKIFILSDGDKILRNTQLGHTVLKHALYEQLSVEFIDLLVTKAGACILENGDSNEIWKTMFFNLKQNTDGNFKVNALQVLFHIGVNYTRRDSYGRNAEDLAKYYHMQEEFEQARKQYETFALTQITRQAKNTPQLEQMQKRQQYFYH